MKIIDLLNKIANGEEVPKKINYIDYVLTYDEETQDYYNEPNCTYSLLDNILFKLNDEVEILEEEKKIPEKIDLAWQNAFDEQVQQDCIKMICKNINEIIDYLKNEEK